MAEGVPRAVGIFVLGLATGLAIALILVLDDSTAPAAAELPSRPTAPATAIEPPPASASPSATATASQTATAQPAPATATATATGTATATTTPDGAVVGDSRPARCSTVAERGADLIRAVEEAMEGYEGTWGLALVDLDCNSPIVIRPEYRQYPASAGKIVVIIAALRAVQEGVVAFAAIEPHVELVMHHSLDVDTDVVASFVTPAQVSAVLEAAGVSAASSLEYEWRQAVFTPHDLALVWASLLRGEQLDEGWTSYLLGLASEAIFPDGYETFPAAFDIPGYQYGQKAGYWVSVEQLDDLVAAGYVRPEDASSEGFAFAFLLETPLDDLFDPQRRLVFPLVRDFVVAELDGER